MTEAMLRLTVPVDTVAAADFRAAAHAAGTAACIALLTYAAELALKTCPASTERDEGHRALDLAARSAGGEAIDPVRIVDALHAEGDVGLELHLQSISAKVEVSAWSAVVSVLGYAAYHGSLHRGEPPYALVENYALDEALDLVVDPFLSVPGFNWIALGRAVAFIRDHGSKVAEGWGQPMHVEMLRRAAKDEGG